MSVSTVFTKPGVKTPLDLLYRYMLAKLSFVALLAFSAIPVLNAGEHEQQHHQHVEHAAKAFNGVTPYQLREISNPLDTAFTETIELLASDGSRINLQELLETDSNDTYGTDTHIFQFIFTSCTNICPVMSTILQAIQSDVEGEANLISISIDPLYDRPEQLAAYAQLFGALAHWSFFTGELTGIVRLQKRLNVFQQNKMQHQPVTFILKTDRLFRIDGLPSRTTMLAELHRIQQM